MTAKVTGGRQSRPGAPPEGRRIALPDREIGLHEMPDLAAEAPEVEYGTASPRRPWLRSVAVAVVAGAIGLAAGIGVGVTWLGAQPDPLDAYATSLRLEHLAQAPVPAVATNTYSLAREHLAQTPGGFPFIPRYGNDVSVRMEHLAQTPGGFPFIPRYGNDVSLRMEHLAQTPGGFPA